MIIKYCQKQSAIVIELSGFEKLRPPWSNIKTVAFVLMTFEQINQVWLKSNWQSLCSSLQAWTFSSALSGYTQQDLRTAFSNTSQKVSDKCVQLSNIYNLFSLLVYLRQGGVPTWAGHL